jgi:hypothetical protein
VVGSIFFSLDKTDEDRMPDVEEGSSSFGVESVEVGGDAVGEMLALFVSVC